jgi:hypothetical protein
MITYLSSLENTFFNKLSAFPMRTNCAPLLVNLFLSKNLLKTKDLQKLKPLISLCYIDNILPINNPNYANWIPLIHPQKTLR